MLDSALVLDAASFLRERVVRTPVEPSPAMAERLGVPVWFKMECLQTTGSFKIRGAWFALHRLRDQGVDGVSTCSAGNHGLGLAYAARHLGMRALIYVPSSVDGSKMAGLQAMGAEVEASPYAGFDDTEAWTLDRAAASGLPYVSAYDDENVIAGNGGTVGLEVMDQVPTARTVIVPVGGGGMAGGLSIPFKERAPEGRLIAAQLAASPALARSLEAGQAVTRMDPVETLAGGLEGGIGRTAFSLLKRHVDQVVHSSEQAVWEGVRWMLREHRILIEPSAAVAVSACLSGEVIASGPTVVVLSGRNLALDSLRRILAQGDSA